MGYKSVSESSSGQTQTEHRDMHISRSIRLDLEGDGVTVRYRRVKTSLERNMACDCCGDLRLWWSDECEFELCKYGIETEAEPEKKKKKKKAEIRGTPEEGLLPFSLTSFYFLSSLPCDFLKKFFYLLYFSFLPLVCVCECISGWLNRNTLTK